MRTGDLVLLGLYAVLYVCVVVVQCSVHCHAGGDILLTFHLFSYCREIVQIVSQLTPTEFVCSEEGCCSCNI